MYSTEYHNDAKAMILEEKEFRTLTVAYMYMRSQ